MLKVSTSEIKSLFKQSLPWTLAAFALVFLTKLPAAAQGISLNIGDGAAGTSVGVQIIILLTILSVAPSILLMTTSFVRLVIVFSILRQAMGIGQLPPTQILIGLSLILTFLIMQPTFNRVNEEALQPFINQQINQTQFFEKSSTPLKEFMLAQTKEEDIKMSLRIAGIESIDSPADMPMHLTVVAFILSELKIAFQIGFLLFLPFVVIDLIVASALVSIGLMFLPPTTISLPFKIILFVLVDGWNILSEGLVNSFNTGVS